jgi:thymidylate synthase (FAD)
LQPEAERITRAISPALDEILGKTYPVLDDGFVRVVDYMGADESIVQAARVSYGAGTKKVSEDRGLIRYLLRHRHTTPFEMCSLKLHVRVPMDAWRQWIRHRTACLAEGTEIYFDLPGGIDRRGNQLYKLKIEDIWQRFQPTSNTQRPDKQRDPYFKRERVKQMKLRQANDDTLEIIHTNIRNVFKNGSKPVFRFELEDGKTIEATSDHKFLFSDGWSTTKERLSLVNRNGLAVWDNGDHYLQINGQEAAAPLLHQNQEWLNDQYNIKNNKIDDIAEVCGVSYHTIRKWMRLFGIQHAKGGRSRPAWNKGKQYKLGHKPPTPKQLAAIRKARSGPASNFWKGGISSDRESIGRWTTQAAPRIHERNQWTCQLCHQRTSDLHCHHIIPVWADIKRARDEDNLTTLCGMCHREIAGNEIAYVEKLGSPPVKTEWVKRPRIAWNKLTKTRLSRIKSIEYVGEKETYDLEVEGPHHNFIANGIVTHNSVNEYSTRYSVAIDAMQTTAPDQWRTQAQQNKQGSGDPVDPVIGAELSAHEKTSQNAARATYQERIDQGVAREQARKDLPLCTYTEAYWKMDLHNLLHFLALRMDGHAQKEIRDYATVIGEQIVAKWVPLTWEAFLDYRFHATGLSRIESEILAATGGGEAERAVEIARDAGWLAPGKSGFKPNRERREFEAKLREWGLCVPWEQE